MKSIDAGALSDFKQNMPRLSISPNAKATRLPAFRAGCFHVMVPQRDHYVLLTLFTRQSTVTFSSCTLSFFCKPTFTFKADDHKVEAKARYGLCITHVHDIGTFEKWQDFEHTAAVRCDKYVKTFTDSITIEELVARDVYGPRDETWVNTYKNKCRETRERTREQQKQRREKMREYLAERHAIKAAKRIDNRMAYLMRVVKRAQEDLDRYRDKMVTDGPAEDAMEKKAGDMTTTE